ncbi:phosphoribosylanthranilate isomerase [Sphingobacterium paludis]|uniref:N-(5'-phosphoribosyl)anthranilate isomerase n=1 Tax=Sphingobacterium paludis TaxID=1476465 RepID=A0A4R7D493_9SPHI|nr:phosphoribosylanthranilate isomerase [Sphingobacterium paludis]TDS15889.1 phosphoribosylanthranilate isomerase [Sphingobacterium paludis]
MDVQVKVCGMREPENITALVALPIDYIGFIFYEKSPRFIPHVPTMISIPQNIKKIGVFVDAPESYIQEKLEEGLAGIQLHGNESAEACRRFKQQGVLVVKAFGIGQNFDWQQLYPYLDVVDYFLFDTKSTAHGGTGLAFDWTLLTGYPFDVPYFLSGGLSLANIEEAKNLMDDRLQGLDLNSKFESAPAFKDIDKLANALKIIKDE